MSEKSRLARPALRRWGGLLLPLGCRNLPPPVMPKRRLAPLWVLSLGNVGLGGDRRLASFALLGGARRQDHAQEAALQPRRPFDGGDLLQAVVDAVQQVSPDLGVGELSTAEHNRDLDLVALSEELLGGARLELHVVGVDLGLEADLPQDHVLLVLAGVALLLRPPVPVLAV